MGDFDEIFYENEIRSPDYFEESAREDLITFFEKNKGRVFYSRQIEVIFEDKYFHWITNRALRRHSLAIHQYRIPIQPILKNILLLQFPINHRGSIRVTNKVLIIRW